MAEFSIDTILKHQFYYTDEQIQRIKNLLNSNEDSDWVKLVSPDGSIFYFRRNDNNATLVCFESNDNNNGMLVRFVS
jgi:hypothetical protein